MAEIELPGKRQVEGYVTGILGSLDAAGAPWLALARTGEDLQQLGTKGAAFITNQVEQGNKRAVANFERKLRDGLGGFETSIATDQSPETWSQRFEEYVDGFQKAEISEKVPQHQRELFLESFADMTGRARQQIAQRAAVANSRMTVESVTLGIDADVERRDFEGARKKAEQLRGLVPDHTVQNVQRKIDSDAAFYQIRDDIDRDPVEVGKQLDDPSFLEKHPHLTGDAYDRLRGYAEQEGNRAKADLWDNTLNQALNDGTDQKILSKEDLKFLAEENMITPEQRAAYLRTYHADTPPPFDPQLYNEAWGAISTYDAGTDPTGATVAQLRANLATLPLPKESLAELRTRLDERVKPISPKKHKLSGDFAKLTTQSFDAGRFGNWFSYKDHDDDPRTVDAKVIDFPSYGRALNAKRRFTDAFDSWLRNQGDDLDPVKAQETYDQLFERIVLDNDDTASSPLVPNAPASVDFGRDIDRLLGTPSNGSRSTSATGVTKGATFGGQSIRPAGVFYRGARPTIFGGPNDPSDNGRSAFGGRTGDGAKQGVAIPQAVLESTFPGKNKAWFEKNVRVVVKTDDGRQAVLPLADFGTAEHVWQKNGSPVLDLTTGAVRSLGGRPVYKDGKLHSIANLGSLSFALTDGTGTEADLRSMTWEQAQNSWFKSARPTTGDQIASGLAALKSSWLAAQAKDIDPEPWGDGSGGDELPMIDGPGVLPALPTNDDR